MIDGKHAFIFSTCIATVLVVFNILSSTFDTDKNLASADQVKEIYTEAVEAKIPQEKLAKISFGMTVGDIKNIHQDIYTKKSAVEPPPEQDMFVLKDVIDDGIKTIISGIWKDRKKLLCILIAALICSTIFIVYCEWSSRALRKKPRFNTVNINR